ncbi:hypothetical protein LEP1GSC185_3907 [Leptospira licerasiae serovar Varillal str. VAR 010]|nr:hypothetical protein LEP1GSC185_3907 [Leptospira licerasiae serovar Varillal str. VAR 010]
MSSIPIKGIEGGLMLEVLFGLISIIAGFFLIYFVSNRILSKEKTEESILKRVNKHYPEKKVSER